MDLLQQLLQLGWDVAILWFICAGFSYLAHEHMGLRAPWDKM